MSKSINLAKIALGFALVVLAFAFAIMPAAAAFTTSQKSALQAAGFSSTEIAALEAILGGGSSSTSASCDSVYTHSTTMSVGASGNSVMNWQQFLNQFAGQSIATDGAFGPMTRSATMAFQRSQGLVADGVVGPNTANAAANVQDNACDDDDMSGDDDDAVCPAGFVCTPTGDDDDDDAPLSGGAGSLADADWLSAYNLEEVGEGQNDVRVAGMKIKASQGSDLLLRAVTLDFDKVSAGSDFRKYASEVSVWFNGNEVARVSASTFNDDNNYRRSISLSGGIIRADQTGDLVVAVSGVSNIDSADAGDTWNVGFISVRYQDAQGAILSEATGDMESTPDNDTTTDADERQFSFESFASASNTKFKIMSGDDDINNARVIDVDDVNNTPNVELFSFTLRIEGTSDVELRKMPINSTFSGTADSLDDMFRSLTLRIDGDSVDSESSPSGTEIKFDEVKTWLSPGDYNFVLVGDVKKIGTGTFAEGDTVSFTFGETETDDATDFSAKDENGDELSDANKTGTESSDAHAFFDNGIQIVAFDDNGTKSVSIDGTNNDRVELVMNFTVRNFGDTTLYIPNVITNTGNTTGSTTTAPTTAQGIGYHIQTSGSTTAGANDISATLTESDNNLTLKTNSYELKAGKQGTFTLKINVANDGTPDLSNTSHRAFLAGVNWASTDTTTGSSVYTFDLADYKTRYETIGN